eukprot:1036136-Pleurochrysis_carterae.AAC.1
MDLAQLSYVKLVPGAQVDIFKSLVTNWLLSAAKAIVADVHDEMATSTLKSTGAKVAKSISESVRSKLDLFDGL